MKRDKEIKKGVKNKKKGTKMAAVGMKSNGGREAAKGARSSLGHKSLGDIGA